MGTKGLLKIKWSWHYYPVCFPKEILYHGTPAARARVLCIEDLLDQRAIRCWIPTPTYRQSAPLFSFG